MLKPPTTFSSFDPTERAFIPGLRAGERQASSTPRLLAGLHPLPSLSGAGLSPGATGYRISESVRRPGLSNASSAPSNETRGKVS
jgi:hypothetical protein